MTGTVSMRKAGALVTTAAAAALAAIGTAHPAMADVKDGVEAWSRGDFDRAVAEWRAPAEAGDPDAQFNLAQAYRLGRGVPTDLTRAEELYLAAASQGHMRAADTYGLMLFQSGRREAALPYVQAASRRGDPRAQYLLGIAHFNGDLVEKDWVRAYALLTLANSDGLPQAASAIAQMDGHVPLEQRQQAATLAAQMRRSAEATRNRELAAAELARDAGVIASANPPAVAAPPAGASSSPAIPRTIATVETPPSVVAARQAVAEASRVTGTESPATAGADFARPQTAQRPPQVAPARTVEAPPRAAPTQAPPPRTASNAATGGPWRVQLGAFSVPANADRLWSRVAGNPALSGAEKLVIPAGRVVKLQAGGFASRSAAQSACDALKRGGQDCLVTR